MACSCAMNCFPNLFKEVISSQAQQNIVFGVVVEIYEKRHFHLLSLGTPMIFDPTVTLFAGLIWPPFVEHVVFAG